MQFFLGVEDEAEQVGMDFTFTIFKEMTADDAEKPWVEGHLQSFCGLEDGIGRAVVKCKPEMARSKYNKCKHASTHYTVIMVGRIELPKLILKISVLPLNYTISLNISNNISIVDLRTLALDNKKLIEAC